jgi:hypothetical protein
MLRILAEGSFVPNEIQNIRNKYDLKKKKNVTFYLLWENNMIKNINIISSFSNLI